MAIILRAFLALAAELLLCYLCGEALLGNFYKKIRHAFANILIGFLICQSIFEVITLGCYFAGGGLSTVTLIWLSCAGILSLLGVLTLVRRIRHNRQLPDQDRLVRRRAGGREGLALAIALVTVAAFCYYVSINGETNADSRYYIPLVNTTLNTGTLFQYNPYNGVYGNSWFQRRALVTYEIHSAMLCSIFRIPALVVTRITRACQNVLLTSMSVYLLGRRLLWREKPDQARIKSCYLVVLFLFFQLVYMGTYPSSATFFLIRAYEGKALTANVLVLFTMYLCGEVMLCRQKRYLFLLVIALWGAAAISSSGMAVIGIEIGIFMAAFILKRLAEWYKERRYVRN